MAKFPDNTTELEQEWLDESYIDLMVCNSTLHFKVSEVKMLFFLLRIIIGIWYFFL